MVWFSLLFFVLVHTFCLAGSSMEVYTCSSSFEPPSSSPPDEKVVECLALIGTDVSQHTPKGISSLPQDVVFDCVCIIGGIDEEKEALCLSIPSKKDKLRWNVVSDDDIFALRDYLDVKVRALVLEILAESN